MKEKLECKALALPLTRLIIKEFILANLKVCTPEVRKNYFFRDF